MSKKQQVRDRAERVEAMRRDQQRAERRRSAVLVGATLVVVVLLIGAVTYVIQRETAAQRAADAAANAPIDGLQEFPDLPTGHVEQDVTYPQDPPAGGEHSPVWTNCAPYTVEVNDEQSVHSLEHGAVWITYSPDLPADQVGTLTELVTGKDYALLSPRPDGPSPIVASAWGLQLQVDDASDPRLERFLTKYLQGSQAPENGAVCYGGVSPS